MKDTIWALAVLSGLAAGCAHQSAAPPSRPASSGEQEMGYQDAVDLGSTYAVQQGHEGAELHQAERVTPNLWRVRFGLAPKGSGRFLELHIDGKTGTVVKSEELNGVGIKLIPSPKE